LQLHEQWGFDTESWKAAFANFIDTRYSEERDNWKQVLAGYMKNQAPELGVSGTTLGGYEFDQDAVNILRKVEELAGTHQTIMTSQLLLETLLSARTIPDCNSLAETLTERFARGNIELGEFTPFGDQGSTVPTSHGFKNIMDRARV